MNGDSVEPRENKLADELFGLVEKDSGYAHISDGIAALNEDEILQLAEAARDRHAKCIKLLDAFLLHHSKRIALKRPYSPMKPQR